MFEKKYFKFIAEQGQLKYSLPEAGTIKSVIIEKVNNNKIEYINTTNKIYRFVAYSVIDNQIIKFNDWSNPNPKETIHVNYKPIERVLSINWGCHEGDKIKVSVRETSKGVTSILTSFDIINSYIPPRKIVSDLITHYKPNKVEEAWG